MAGFFGSNSVRYQGIDTSLSHPLAFDSVAGATLILQVWQSNGSQLGEFAHATVTNHDFVEVAHHDPSSQFRNIGTTLKRVLDGTETVLDIDITPSGPQVAKGNSKVNVSTMRVVDADFDSIVGEFTDVTSSMWTYPPDQLDGNIHVNITQSDNDVSVSAYPAGDILISHSEIAYDNNGISLSGGGTVSGTHTASSNGVVGTISMSDLVAPRASFVSVQDGTEIQPDYPVTELVVSVDSPTDINNLVWRLQRQSDDLFWDGETWVSAAFFRDETIAGAALPVLAHSIDGGPTFDGRLILEGGDTYTFTVNGEDSNGLVGPTTTAVVTTGVWEFSDPVSFTTFLAEPELVNDSVTLVMNGFVDVDVTANDTNVAPGFELSIQAAPANGVAFINEDGPVPTIVYTPDGNYFGPDSFEYRVENPDGGFDTAVVSLLVVDNEPPTVSIVTPQAGQTLPFGTASVDLTGTASDNDVVDLVQYRIDGGPWRAASGTDAWSATLTGLLDGVTYTVDVRAFDREGNVSNVVTRLFSVATDGANPTLQITGPASDLPAGTTSIIVQGTATDNVGVDRVIYRVGAGAFDEAVLNGNSWSVLLEGLTGGQTFSFAAAALDAEGNSSGLSTRTFTVGSPPIANGDAETVIQNASITIDVLANDVNIDAAAVLTIEVAPTSGTAVVVA